MSHDLAVRLDEFGRNAMGDRYDPAIMRWSIFLNRTPGFWQPQEA